MAAKSKTNKKSLLTPQNLNMAYGLGASIVILGALFKILHWEIPGTPINGSLLLAIGLITEALIFGISAFEKVDDGIDWSIVYPELAGGEARQQDADAEGLLSKKLDKIFYDSDQVIEEKLGVDVSMIFEYEGEEGFREREKDILQELVSKKNIVLATGGGIILSKSNRDLLSENGIVIYLKSNQKDLILRTKNDKTRPLLKNGNIELIIKKLCKEREPLYEEIADFEIMTKNKRIHEVVNEIITIIN